MKPSHTHKYIRIKTDKKALMKCAIPGCRHFIARMLAVGRESLCWKCGEVFFLTMENTTLKKPCCETCRRKNRGEIEFDITALLKG